VLLLHLEKVGISNSLKVTVSCRRNIIEVLFHTTIEPREEGCLLQERNYRKYSYDKVRNVGRRECQLRGWIKLRQIPYGCQGATEDGLNEFLK